MKNNSKLVKKGSRLFFPYLIMVVNPKLKKKSINKKRKKKKTWRDRAFSIVWATILLSSIGMLLYPSLSNMWNQCRNNQLSQKYDKKVRNISKERLDYEWKKAKKYNKWHTFNYVKGHFGVKNYPLHDPYKSYLNITGDEIMGTVIIPKINIKLPIYHGLGAYALSHGCGHIEGTSLPVGGKSSHCVLAAHRGLASAKLFTDLDKMKDGDIFYMKVLDRTLAYKVDDIKVVDPSDTKPIRIFKSKDYVTLLTGTPFGINTDRLLVRGHRIPVPESAEKQMKVSWLTMDIVYRVLIAALIFIFIAFLSSLRRSRKKKKKKKIS